MKWEVRTMRSVTLYFNWTVYKKTVARFWPLWAAYFVIWLIFLPLQGLMYLRMDANDLNGFGGSYMENFARYTVASRAGRGCLSATTWRGGPSPLCPMW